MQGTTTVKSAKLVRVRGKGLQVRVRVRCSADADGACAGSLIVKRKVNTRLLASSDAVAKTKNVTLAKKKFSVPAGATRTVKAPLTKPGRKVFSNTRTLKRVKVIARASDENGKLPTTIKVVKLKVPTR